jgi:hypothetical protein
METHVYKVIFGVCVFGYKPVVYQSYHDHMGWDPALSECDDQLHGCGTVPTTTWYITDTIRWWYYRAPVDRYIRQGRISVETASLRACDC